MERNQAISLVRETFTARFDEGRFTLFIRNLVNHLDESKKQVWTLKKDAFRDYVNHFARVGTYTDPRGERVDVLIIHLRKETTLARGRVTLRNFVADYLATGHGQGKAAVIAAFVSPTEADWRFSFIKLDYTLESTELGIVTERAQLTPARRYSYLVGANENCHTAQKQFLELLETDVSDPTVDALEAAFSVEKVTKEFYDHYKDLFERGRDALLEFLRVTPVIAKEFDDRGIVADDFAKKLLGQIVFLYFLQKKGWFGVERGKDWGGGRKDFLRHLFTHRVDYAHVPGGRKREANFFNDILEPLFYEALAYPREADDHYYSRFDCRIPFLNGGLFEPLYGYRWSETDILLPDSLFSEADTVADESARSGILDVFDRYNFTVNEAEPLEKEVAVDPEMLGKVFENLLPENIRHAAGIYYTPRVIVHYMCQQALLHYLTTHAPDIPQGDLDMFLRLAERFADFDAVDTKKHADKRLPDSIAGNAARLDDLLDTVTVCDPAIGSGAFPVGMMHEIVRARAALTPSLKKQGRGKNLRDGQPRTAYELKRHAIHHSLYGVDYDPGAVEIAKLRLWLSMVVDEDHIGDIQPLPNLDYKIMQGNSLLQEFEGIRLFDEKILERPDEDREQRITELKGKIRALQAEAIRAHGSGKRGAAAKMSAERDITRLKKTLDALAQNQSHEHIELDAEESWRRLARLQQLHEEFFKESNRKRKDEIRGELEKLEDAFMEARLREQGREEAIADLKRASAKHCKPFFLWWLHFSEIKQKRGGFDITIQNSPYVRIQELTKDSPRIAERLKTLYKSAGSGNYDLYVVFTELSLKLLAPTGFAAFIQPHKFFNAKYGRPLRKILSEGRHVQHIVYFGDLQVFEGATNYVCLLFLTRQPNDSFRYVKVEDKEQWYLTRQGIEARLPASKLTEENWSIVIGRSGSVFEQLTAAPQKLEDVTSRIFQGIKTSADKIYIVEHRGQAGQNVRMFCPENQREYTIESALLHPLIKGGDSKAYAIQPTKRRILFPYAKDTSGTMALIPEETLREKYPLSWKYLHDHRAYLRAREDGKMAHEGWYGYGRTQALEVMALPKIFTPDIAQRASYSYDPTGEFFFTGGAAGGYGILPIEGESSAFLLGLLNSNVLDWFLHQTTTPMKGGWFSYEARYIHNLPIPESSAGQRSSVEQLVEYLLWLNRGDSLDGELSNSTGRRLMAGYFEQWVNALVYELFFPEQLHAADLHFFDILQDTGLSPLSDTPGRELSYLRDLFEEIYRPEHRLRRSLFALDSIEEVRIIQGKA
jgi:Eco57I restriction-modification methylase/TaqI-like C-terminal specificity domain